MTVFLVKDIFYSKSNHSFSCRATFDDNANGTIEIQICNEISYKPITDDSAFALKETIDEDFPGICTSPKSVVYNFNFTQASNGTRLRCLATDHNRNMSATTECLPLVLQPPGKAELFYYITIQYDWWDIRVCVSWKDGLCVTEVKVNFGVDIAESRNNIYMTFVYHCTDLFLIIFLMMPSLQ